ncbi:hypothetical protein CAEBREN_28202 [Caenorhabditis brenneri]|uniref:UPAR/Ly6 domain-containing protein n=1 Tax=Caenorhabditis brenneri TaxID=135651 RepID=G0MCF6_CAEBE|nr:hypothetical protein CAEBREN_28202 [Caenorhabditis brenneri]
MFRHLDIGNVPDRQTTIRKISEHKDRQTQRKNKTDFMFYSNQKNQSYKTYTVRSCSYETGCKWDRSKACRKNALEYAGKGCADKYCCGKDKCNGSQGWAATMGSLVVLMIFIF